MANWAARLLLLARPGLVQRTFVGCSAIPQLSPSHSHDTSRQGQTAPDSEFTGIQSRPFDRSPTSPSPSRRRASPHTLRSRAAHVPTQQAERSPSRRNRSHIHRFSAHVGENSHIPLASALRRHSRSSCHLYTTSPRALRPILVGTSFSIVNRIHTSIAHVQGARNLPSADAPPPIILFLRNPAAQGRTRAMESKTPCYRSRSMRNHLPHDRALRSAGRPPSIVLLLYLGWMHRKMGDA